MSEPYKVVPRGEGCPTCQHNDQYDIVGPDDTAQSQSWGDAAEAEYICDLLNIAHQQGRVSYAEEVLERLLLVAQFSDLAIELEKHSNDHIHDALPDNVGAAVEGVCADRINAILKPYRASEPTLAAKDYAPTPADEEVAYKAWLGDETWSPDEIDLTKGEINAQKQTETIEAPPERKPFDTTTLKDEDVPF
jgi:hypothetical protein